jgi:hypothetical protein
VYRCFFADVSCFGKKLFGIALADLFLYHNDHLMQFIEGDGDYEVPVFLFNGTDTLNCGGLLGFADDNWRDGTQSYVFGFVAPFLQVAGYGFTTTSIHEVGHHLGLSHPHGKVSHGRLHQSGEHDFSRGSVPAGARPGDQIGRSTQLVAEARVPSPPRLEMSPDGVEQFRFRSGLLGSSGAAEEPGAELGVPMNVVPTAHLIFEKPREQQALRACGFHHQRIRQNVHISHEVVEHSGEIGWSGHRRVGVD